MQKRMNSIVMWIGIVVSAFVAIGGNPQLLTSWSEFGGAVLSLLRNPYMLACFGYTLFAIVNNPTKAQGI